MRFVPCQHLESIRYSLVNLSCSKLLDRLVIVDAILVRGNNFPRIDDVGLLDVHLALLPFLARCPAYLAWEFSPSIILDRTGQINAKVVSQPKRKWEFEWAMSIISGFVEY